MNKIIKAGIVCVVAAQQFAIGDVLAQQKDIEPPPLVRTVTPPPAIRTVDTRNDPTQITLAPDSKTIIISGRIQPGAAARFKIILDAISTVQSVSLISPGGRLEEAAKIYEAIKDRRLDTYVDQICMSACTMIFLGGRERSATPQAKIGFHQPYLVAGESRTNATLVAAMRRFYDEASVRPSFTDKAMSTPSSGMWYPQFDELLTANVVTKRVTGGATSTLFSLFNTRDALESALLREETFRLLRAKHFDIFEAIVDAGWTAKLDGKNDDQIGSALREKLMGNFQNMMTSADDAVFINYIKLAGAQTRAARDIGFDACYLLSQGQLNIQQNLPEKYWKEELEILGAALRSASPRVIVTEKEAESSLVKTFDEMTAEEIQAIADPTKANRIDVCNATIKMYEAIEKMPERELVLVSRYIFTSP